LARGPIVSLKYLIIYISFDYLQHINNLNFNRYAYFEISLTRHHYTCTVQSIILEYKRLNLNGIYLLFFQVRTLKIQEQQFCTSLKVGVQHYYFILTVRSEFRGSNDSPYIIR